MLRRATLLLPVVLLLGVGCSQEKLDCLNGDECNEDEGEWCNQWTFTCTAEMQGGHCTWGDEDCDDGEGGKAYCVFPDQASIEVERGYCIRDCRSGCPEGSECADAPGGLGDARVCLPDGVTCAWHIRELPGDNWEPHPIGDCEP